MKQKLTLIHPVSINGKQISELEYDTDEIDGALFMEAEVQQKAATSYKGGMAPMEFNTGLHLYLGMAAVIAIHRDYDWTDLSRLKGRDIVQLAQVGRSFITGSAEESQEKSSDEHTETMPESTTPASPTSKG